MIFCRRAPRGASHDIHVGDRQRLGAVLSGSSVIMIVAFAPGGADDATARILQDPMYKALGQPIVIENVGGAGDMIAIKTSRAKPDGYAILLSQDVLVAGMALYPDHTFDAGEGFRADWPRQCHRTYACRAPVAAVAGA
jgi:hypothetical protein